MPSNYDIANFEEHKFTSGFGHSLVFSVVFCVLMLLFGRFFFFCNAIVNPYFDLSIWTSLLVSLAALSLRLWGMFNVKKIPLLLLQQCLHLWLQINLMSIQIRNSIVYNWSYMICINIIKTQKCKQNKNSIKRCVYNLTHKSQTTTWRNQFQ